MKRRIFIVWMMCWTASCFEASAQVEKQEGRNIQQRIKNKERETGILK